MSIVRFQSQEKGISAAKTAESGTGKSSNRPSPVQLRYLRSGFKQAGGKLPLFDDKGQAIKAATIRSCIEKGWAEPWFSNPTKPDWLVCKLTDKGRKVAER